MALIGAPMWFDSAGYASPFLGCVEFPIFEIAQPRRKAFADQGEQSEDVIACTARIGEVFLDVEDRVLIEQPVEHIGCLAFGRADRQDAEVAVLI